MNVVDLTDDDAVEHAADSASTVHNVIQPWPPLTSHGGPLPSISTTIRPAPVSSTPYTIDQSSNFSNPFHGAAKQPISRGNWPTIRFSLINTKEFTAKASCTVSKEVISTIKLVSGVRFDTENRQFVFPIACHSQLVAALGTLCVHVEPLPQESRNRLTMQKRMESSFCIDEFERVLQEKLPPKLMEALAPFQRDGVRFVYKNKGRAIIADEMGLGKTIQAIACSCVYRESWPVLVVAPSSARHHWKMELETWLCPDACPTSDIVIIDSPSKVHFLMQKPHLFAILSYSYLAKFEDILCAKKYRMIIIDESHFLKNGKAKRTRSMNTIVESAARMVLLTGTPALSRPYELFTQLHLIAPLSWHSEQSFCRRYCQGKGTGTGTSSWGGEGKVGASHTEELHAMLFGTIMIRRLKKDMLTELPQKTRHIVRVDIADNEQQQVLSTLLSMVAMSKSKRKKPGRNNFVDDFLNSHEDHSVGASSGDNHQPPQVTTQLLSNSSSLIPASSKTNDELPLLDNVPDFSLPPSVYSTANGNSSEPRGQNIESCHRVEHQENEQYPTKDNLGDAQQEDQKEDQQKDQQKDQHEDHQERRQQSPEQEIHSSNKYDVGELPTKRMVLMELFTISGTAKVEAIIQHVEKFLADPLSGKLLIFAHHKKVLDAFSNYLARRRTDYIRIDGSTLSKSRHQKMLRFQTVPSCRVAVLAITAAGVAITLTAASTVFFAELFWTPGSMLQAEDRVHRIGQLSPVNITYFLGNATVDDVLWPMIQKKMKTLGELFEGERNVELVAQSESCRDEHSEEEDEKTLNTGTSMTATAGRNLREGGGEVAGLLEEISLEEEQKLLLQQEQVEAETEPDEEGDTSEVNENGINASDLISNQGKHDAEKEDDRVFEYDGLAQAMLNSGDEKNSELEVVLDEKNEHDSQHIDTARRGVSTQNSRVHVVDLVDEGCDDVVVSQPRCTLPSTQEGNRREYICIDLDDDDDNDDDDNDDANDDQGTYHRAMGGTSRKCDEVLGESAISKKRKTCNSPLSGGTEEVISSITSVACVVQSGPQASAVVSLASFPTLALQRGESSTSISDSVPPT